LTNQSPPTGFVALVPMRHHSERVPGKNFRILVGKPLYSYVLETLLACPEIAEVVVDTDSPVIMEGVTGRFPSIRLLKRPQHLRADSVPMNEVLAHDVEQIRSDFYLQTHSTNPLLRPSTVSRAIRAFLDGYPRNDSLFSVTRIQTRLWDTDARPINHDPMLLLRTQELPPVYEENSCLYIFERGTFLARRNRLGKNPFLFEMDRQETLDIDEELDFEIAEFLIQKETRVGR